ncbi:hypothetical protein [Pseudomonas mandelii]|uniref:hypothetical protein n=1 Tax=Pseudomonas mandelii TaxID=75612 RepID=UPI00224B02D8|nr:hypothetical protein [Pseudomonas mandelii]MCX2899366.1 hypothetical protein [Pseudomonas mandelii]
MVEHWTSEAEHFYFRYDLKARTFRATYLLGSEELHSKADLSLITVAASAMNATPFDLDELQRYDHDQGSPDDRQRQAGEYRGLSL